ncbi:glycosyltransferase family 39 protein, partial [bacterium]|nr:glycosyltransferase family 39 protein [bacterium]
MTKSEFWNSKISLPVISFLMFLIIVGFFLRSHDIDKKSFWEDEGATIGCAKYNLEMYVHPPLYLRILGIVIKFFGDSPTTLRLPSVLCGILLIPLTYLFSKDFFDKKTALYSAFFMAISAYSIEVSLECRMYVMEGLFSLMAVYSFW